MTHINETVLYVNLKILEENFKCLKSKLSKDNKIVAVIKAYAYGLGDIKIAKKLEDLGVDVFWVADFDEGVKLRNAGIKLSIIVANPGSKSMDVVLKNNLEPVIFNHRMLDLYSTANSPVDIHLKFNTGMNRYGFEAEDVSLVLEKISQHPNLKLKSICSHLSSSNDPNKDEFSNGQIELFNSISDTVNTFFNTDIPTHIVNSNGTLRFSINSSDWVRLGISLFGGLYHNELQQIFTLKSVISQIRSIKEGDCVGYQNSFTAKEKMKIAVVPMGYADGLNRKLGNSRGHVLIHNKKCPIIGDISMDSFIADISSITVEEGDEVVIFSPEHSVSLLANELETIPYEIMATLNRRIKRIYLNE